MLCVFYSLLFRSDNGSSTGSSVCQKPYDIGALRRLIVTAVELYKYKNHVQLKSLLSYYFILLLF